ncbi:hypothetical protein [Roseovarius sp. MMSF_3305]|uniref:hypothetical protein n=1 Tax=Roseovarius sp. MMSF_3305 TaxID=3046697 RepID=UPI00273E40FC|nr:hypothetical protein [Roseovarius sp. MMSF_3305]
MMWPFTIGVMSGRFFQSRDIDGLKEALTDPPDPRPVRQRPLVPNTGPGARTLKPLADFMPPAGQTGTSPRAPAP